MRLLGWGGGGGDHSPLNLEHCSDYSDCVKNTETVMA